MVDRLRDLLGGNDDDEQSRLPEHEYSDPNTVGGGIMGAGGDAVDRGTTQMTPSGEDAFEERGDVDGDTSASRTYEGVEPTPADLFGGGAREQGEDVAGDDDGDEAVPPQTFRSL